MPKCPNCGAELSLSRGKYVCDCDFVCKVEDFEKLQWPWHKKLCSDSTMWYEEAFQDYPYPIAHEYQRLRTLLESGQIFGAMLQVKDVMEVLLKFPILIIVSEIYHAKKESSKLKDILHDMLSKYLSLGDWQSIGEKILKCIGNDKSFQNTMVIEIIKDILDVYQHEKIVKWRNSSIGHGALCFEDDETFRTEITAKLKAITAYLLRRQEDYKRLNLILINQNQEISLLGSILSDEAGVEKSELMVEHGTTRTRLHPFILYLQGGVYFFDTFLKNEKNNKCILNYPHGKRDRIVCLELARVYEGLKMDNQRAQLEGSVEGEVVIEEMQKILDDMATMVDYQPVPYLDNWLRRMLNEHTKGIFHLKMERGTGKTTFARSHDQLGMNKVQLDGVSVRAHYINDTYMYKANIFKSNLNKIFNTVVSREGQEHLLGKLTEFNPDSTNWGKDLANYLHEFRQLHGKEKILLILDALDEIPLKTAGEKTVFDFIPQESLLADGVYLLLTSRTGEQGDEISEFVRTNLSRIIPTAALNLTRNDKDNISVLEAFVKNKMKIQSNIEISELLKMSEHRFLYVNILKDIYRFRAEKLPHGVEIYQTFLDIIRETSGEKRYANLVRLLCVLATAYEPLTRKEIVTLLGEQTISFKMFADIIDLKSMIKVERSYRGDLFSITHPEVIRVVKERLQEEIRELVTDYLKIIDKETEDFQIKNDADTYLLAHIVDYASEYFEEEPEEMFGSGFGYFLFEAALRLQNNSLLDYHRVRAASTYSQCIILKNMLDENDLVDVYLNCATAYLAIKETQMVFEYFNLALAIIESLKLAGVAADEKLAIIHMNRGVVYLERREINKALEDLNLALEIVKKLQKDKMLEDEDLLAKVCTNRGIAFAAMGEIDKALKDYKLVLAFKESLMKHGKLVNEFDLAILYMNRGTAFCDNREIGRAIEDYNNARVIIEKLKNTDELVNENELANVYMNLGLAHSAIRETDKAIENYNLALAIRIRLRQEGRLVDENDLARLYMNRGVTFWERADQNNSLQDYNLALEIAEKLQQVNKLADENELAKIYVNRGNVYREHGDIDLAIRDYNNALKIMKRIYETNRLADENDLAKVFMNRGIANYVNGESNNAILDYDEALAVLIKLQHAERLMDESNLVKVYYNCGMAYLALEDIFKAIENYNLAVKNIQIMQQAKKSVDENLMALVYMGRGSAYRDIQEMGKAIEDYTQALAIVNSLENDGKLEKENSLIDLYICLGTTYCDSLEIGKAIDNYNLALEYVKKLQHAGKPTDNVLAKVLMNRGNAYRYDKEIDKSIEDYDQALAISERLQQAGKLDENDLLLLYLNRGNAYSDITEIDKSLEDYNRALAIAEKLLHFGKPVKENVIAMVYKNRGIQYFLLEKFNEALNDNLNASKLYLKIIVRKSYYQDYLIQSLYKALLSARELKLLHEHKGFFCSCLELVNLESLSENETKMFNDVLISLAEDLREQVELIQFNDDEDLDVEFKLIEIAQVEGKYYGLYNSSKDQNCITIPLLANIVEENELANVYMNRGNAYANLGEMNKAIEDYNMALGIMEKFLKSGKPTDENHLATAYINRGVMFFELQNFNEALSNTLSAIGIYQRIIWRRESLSDYLVQTLYIALMSARKLGRLCEYENTFVDCYDLIQEEELSGNESEMFNEIKAVFAENMREQLKEIHINDGAGLTVKYNLIEIAQVAGNLYGLYCSEKEGIYLPLKVNILDEGVELLIISNDEEKILVIDSILGRNKS